MEQSVVTVLPSVFYLMKPLFSHLGHQWHRITMAEQSLPLIFCPRLLAQLGAHRACGCV